MGVVKALNTLHLSFYCSRGNDQRYSMQIPTIIMVGICNEYLWNDYRFYKSAILTLNLMPKTLSCGTIAENR